MLQHLKKLVPFRWLIYIALFFFLLLTSCKASIGVTTTMKKTKTLAETSTALTTQLTLEDLTISPSPTPTN